MKKYSIYIALFAIGLILGWFIFGNSSEKTVAQDQQDKINKNQHWTCSMHPQIMQPESGDCPICGMDLIPADHASDGLSPNQFEMTKNAIALANIETLVIGKNGRHSNSIILSGTITENDKATAVQTAHFEGRIERLYIRSTGESVSKGQLLALIYSPELTTAQKELLTAAAVKSTQPEIYRAVRNKLKLWKLSENQINSIEKSKKVKTNFPVYADVSGIVTEKFVEEGNHVGAGTQLLKIANLNMVWAHLDAYENHISQIHVGDEVLITTNTFPSKKIKAQVSFIDPILNSSTRTVTVRTILDNRDGALKPGMFVEGSLEPKKNTTENSGISIPKSAVLWTGKRSITYVKKSGAVPVFETREVLTGMATADHYEILEGLEEGEEIVVNGTFTVDAAAQLQGKKSMMNKFDEKSDDQMKTLSRIEVSPIFKSQLTALYKAYIPLKEALTKDSPVSAQQKTIDLIEKLLLMNPEDISGEEIGKVWPDHWKNMNNSSMAISKTSDVKVQRDQFMTLSNSLLKSIELFGINEIVYIQYCPMANNDKGAIWLSDKEQILNPYFGASMLKCGTVNSVIKH